MEEPECNTLVADALRRSPSAVVAHTFVKGLGEQRRVREQGDFLAANELAAADSSGPSLKIIGRKPISSLPCRENAAAPVSNFDLGFKIKLPDCPINHIVDVIVLRHGLSFGLAKLMIRAAPASRARIPV
jgi:hypothetical protein